MIFPGFASRSAPARCPLSRGRTPGSGQGPSPRLPCRHERPAGAPPPRHQSHRAELSPSRRPGTSWKLRNLRRWLFFLAWGTVSTRRGPPGPNDLAGFRQPFLAGAQSRSKNGFGSRDQLETPFPVMRVMGVLPLPGSDRRGLDCVPVAIRERLGRSEVSAGLRSLMHGA